METYFDSHLDLLQRNLAKTSDRLKSRAEETLNDIKKDVLKDGRFKIIPSSSTQIERDLQKYKLKVRTCAPVHTRELYLNFWFPGLATFTSNHRDVALRESYSHARKSHVFHGRHDIAPHHVDVCPGPRVRLVLIRISITLANCPFDRWIHVAYTVQIAYYLPLRVYMYKKRAWHYFLFDLCYYINVLDLIFIWVVPTSPALFVACYCLSLGSLASAVITWRNSLVFHDWDKVTSLFIHIYPPLVFSVIR